MIIFYQSNPNSNSMNDRIWGGNCQLMTSVYDMSWVTVMLYNKAKQTGTADNRVNIKGEGSTYWHTHIVLLKLMTSLRCQWDFLHPDLSTFFHTHKHTQAHTTIHLNILKARLCLLSWELLFMENQMEHSMSKGG